MLGVACVTSHITHDTQHLTHNTQHLTPHTQHLTHNTSHLAGHGYSESSTDAPNTAANSNLKNYHATFLTSKDMDRPPGPSSAPRCCRLPLFPLLPAHPLSFVTRFHFKQIALDLHDLCCSRVVTLPSGPTPPPAAADLLLQEQEAARSTRGTSAGFDTAAIIYNNTTAARCSLNTACSVRHAPHLRVTNNKDSQYRACAASSTAAVFTSGE